MNEAVEQDNIQKTTHPKLSKKRLWRITAIVLALAIGATAILYGMGILKDAQSKSLLRSATVSKPDYPERLRHYYLSDSGNWFKYNEQFNQPEGYADSLTPFFKESICQFLEDSNSTCSPLNVYMALAMLAETSGGNTRQQILDLFGLTSIESLRFQAGHVWNAHYQDDGFTTLTLANSLWLDRDYRFNRDTADILAENYYAFSFEGDLGTPKMNQALQYWLNTQTGGLLEDQVQNIALDPATVFALASTVYYKTEWEYKFNKDNNTVDSFHTPSGDVKATYMHKTIKDSTYYYDDHYGAIALNLKDDGHMWIILPDEGYTPRQLLDEGDFLAMILESEGLSRGAEIILSLPKFDIASDMDLIGALKSMGITDAFAADAADFSPLTKDSDGLSVGQISHGARVAIDEEGITAAAYTSLMLAGGMPPNLDQIEFNVNRPFLFVVTSRDGLPLFAGTVQQP